jgi:hypothetical protein
MLVLAHRARSYRGRHTGASSAFWQHLLDTLLHAARPVEMATAQTCVLSVHRCDWHEYGNSTWISCGEYVSFSSPRISVPVRGGESGCQQGSTPRHGVSGELQGFCAGRTPGTHRRQGRRFWLPARGGGAKGFQGFFPCLKGGRVTDNPDSCRIVCQFGRFTPVFPGPNRRECD